MKKLFLICILLVSVSISEASWVQDKMMEMRKGKVGDSTPWKTFSNKLALRPYNQQNEIDCLAKNIYFEARDQLTKGQLAVALVTINRVKSKHFPNTICKVVHQANRKNGKIVLHKCHFSWYCDGKSDLPKDKMSWAISKLIAKAMVKEPMKDFLHGATHYHRKDVDPYWNRKMLKYSTIGDHIFYIDPYRR